LTTTHGCITAESSALPQASPFHIEQQRNLGWPDAFLCQASCSRSAESANRESPHRQPRVAGGWVVAQEQILSLGEVHRSLVALFDSNMRAKRVVPGQRHPGGGQNRLPDDPHDRRRSGGRSRSLRCQLIRSGGHAIKMWNSTTRDGSRTRPRLPRVIWRTGIAHRAAGAVFHACLIKLFNGPVQRRLR
jgi:hypothetical protein